MGYAVKIPIMYTIFFMEDRPEEREDMEIEEGARVEVPPNLYRRPDGSEAPEVLLCRSTTDPKHYRVFHDRKDVDPSEFTPTGMTYGGFYTRPMWERFSEAWPEFKSFYTLPDTDPPGAMEEAMRLIRGAR
jgi:hypothetical protein